jgi:hypothetical protein
MDRVKKVYAVVTEEESDAFMKINYEIEAITKLQDALVDRMTKAKEKERKLWKELSTKYNLPEKTLQLDHSTKEIKDL